MPGPVRRFPDVQRLLVVGLEELAGDGRTAIETPEDLESQLPFVRVMRTGGGRDRLHDMPTVDVDVFAATYTAAETLAEQIAEWLIGPPSGVREFDRVICEVAPRELPWVDDNTVRRWGATYHVVTRRHLAA